MGSYVSKPKKTLPHPVGEPFNEFLVGVFYNVGPGPDRYVALGRLTADMGCSPPIPPISNEEMQSVAFAAKMAMANVLRARKSKK